MSGRSDIHHPYNSHQFGPSVAVERAIEGLPRSVGLARNFGHSPRARNDADRLSHNDGIVGLERFVEKLGDTLRGAEARVRSAGLEWLGSTVCSVFPCSPPRRSPGRAPRITTFYYSVCFDISSYHAASNFSRNRRISSVWVTSQPASRDLSLRAGAGSNGRNPPGPERG
jgi:hypothetical protein